MRLTPLKFLKPVRKLMNLNNVDEARAGADITVMDGRCRS